MNQPNFVGNHPCSWYSGVVTCVLCGNEWVAVWCECSNTKALECGKCHAMAGMPDPET